MFQSLGCLHQYLFLPPICLYRYILGSYYDQSQHHIHEYFFDQLNLFKDLGASCLAYGETAGTIQNVRHAALNTKKKIHHEDFKMLQINLDFAITNILFELMSKIKGISNSESEGAKYKELLKKILDLSAQSAMYLKPELIMTFSYDKGMLLVDLSKNNEKNEESDFELLKLTLENICLSLSSSANQDQNNNNDLNEPVQLVFDM